MTTRELEPKTIWNNFEDLNAVPRPSKKEDRIIVFAKEFGNKLGLDTYVDKVGNVIIKKPATKGLENKKTVILQSHLDMVCQKNSDTDFDFDTQGIQSYIDGEWVKAKGTTLGADNGIGVAAIMSLLESDNIPHPAIEALFTIDEETGMTGAFNLEKGKLDGKILLNLDTEDDDEFSIGCAGGIDTNTSYKYASISSNSNDIAINILVNGLFGGHSGMDIHLERGNANKIMNRIIAELVEFDVRIVSIDGGSLRNAIPRESKASVLVNSNDAMIKINSIAKTIISEYTTSDKGLNIEAEICDLPKSSMTIEDSNKVINAISATFNGVYKMSMSIKGLVETSSSLARVIVKDNLFTTQSLQRSSVDSSKIDVAHNIGAAYKLIGANVEHTGSYPGWAPNSNSEILEIMKPLYIKMYNENPRVQACHAGLECGILGERYPGLDMISFGPTIRNPHSPDEKVNIATVKKFWEFLQAVLIAVPNK